MAALGCKLRTRGGDALIEDPALGELVMEPKDVEAWCDGGDELWAEYTLTAAPLLVAG